MIYVLRTTPGHRGKRENMLACPPRQRLWALSCGCRLADPGFPRSARFSPSHRDNRPMQMAETSLTR